ncbi:MAG: hypothetical protein GF334_03775 [Candidatus Altiarchaeales archaeon]|nr:hypothetical protein [Candidatus Altiarchaeales archaeon]
MVSESKVKAAQKGLKAASTIAVSAALADRLQREEKKRDSEYSKKFEEIPLMGDSRPLDRLNQKPPESLDESIEQVKELQGDLNNRAQALQNASPDNKNRLKQDLTALESEINSLTGEISSSQQVLEGASNRFQAGQTRDVRTPGLIGSLLKSHPAGYSLAALTGVSLGTQVVEKRFHIPTEKSPQQEELKMLDSQLGYSQTEADKLSETLSASQFSEDLGGSAESAEQLSRIKGSSKNPNVAARVTQSASTLLDHAESRSPGEQIFAENISKHKYSAAAQQVEGDYQGAGGELSEAYSSKLRLEEFKESVAPIAKAVAAEHEVDENQVLEAAARLSQDSGTTSRQQLRKTLDKTAKASKAEVGGRRLPILPVDEVAKTFLRLEPGKEKMDIEDLRGQAVDDYVRQTDIVNPSDGCLENFLAEDSADARKALWLEELRKTR